MDYFDFYEIAPTFFPDLPDLKKRYYQKSRSLHPDFYTQESSEKQEEVLKLSALNNEAYNTLIDHHALVAYILRSKGLLVDGDTPALDPSFLMEMMEVNEALMDMQMGEANKSLEEITNEVEELMKEIKSAAMPDMKAFEADPESAELKNVLQYHLKNKYLLRIKDKLNTFTRP